MTHLHTAELKWTKLKRDMIELSFLSKKLYLIVQSQTSCDSKGPGDSTEMKTLRVKFRKQEGIVLKKQSESQNASESQISTLQVARCHQCVNM